jgi:hypothetical protein
MGEKWSSAMNEIDTLTGRELVEGLDEVAARVAGGNERLIVEHRGRRFALVSLEDLESRERADAEWDQATAESLRATSDAPDPSTDRAFRHACDALRSSGPHNLGDLLNVAARYN